MSSCTIIPDSAVKEILISQSRDETLVFMADVRQCLTDYSLSKEREYQPTPDVVVRPGGQKTLFRSFTSQTNVGCKIIVDPAADQHGKKPPLHGTLVLTDNAGSQCGLLNAAEVTAYRTSLASMIPYVERERTKNVVAFGAGKQALWHVRLALVLRGSEIDNITVINRSAEKGNELVKRLRADSKERWKVDARFTALDPSQSDYENHLKEALGQADVIFCTVPSTEPLFPAAYIQQRSAEAGMPLITAIGSWQPNMIEIDSELIKHIVDDPSGGRVLLVDDRDGCLDHAGEVVQCELEGEQLAEVGAVLGSNKEKSAISLSFSKWLRTGLVIYKSVGVSVMDLTAGQRLLTLAKEKGMGTTVPDF